MKNVRYEHNYQGIVDFRHSEPVMREIRERAERVADAFGPGAGIREETDRKAAHKYRKRPGVDVNNAEGDYNDLKRGNDLLKALEAGRG